MYNESHGDSNPRALSKAPVALCNPRWPAPQRRSNPYVRMSERRSVSALRRKLHYVSSFFLLNCDPLRWARSLVSCVPLLLSKSNPLCWASIWVWVCPQNWSAVTKIPAASQLLPRCSGLFSLGSLYSYPLLTVPPFLSAPNGGGILPGCRRSCGL